MAQGATLHDPLADLKAEIAAEEAGLSQQEQDTQAAELAAAQAEAEAGEDDAEPGDEQPEAKAEGEAKPEDAEPPGKDKKAKADDEERVVPASRFNQVATENRQFKKQLADMQKRLDELANPKKPGEVKQLTPEEQRAQIRNEERASLRLELQLNDFTEAGNGKYTEKGFNTACDKISELIDGPNDLVAIAIEATGTPKLAADAIYLLGQNDVPEIEAFLALSPLKKAAQLAKLAATRPSRAKPADDEPAYRPKRPKVEDDDPPAPLRPLKGNARIPEGLGDDVPDDVWNKRFEDQIMNKGRTAH